MSQETLNLIFGGLISLASICLTSIATLLAAWITYHFQRKSDERKRQWELEDKRIERNIESKDKNAEEAIAYLNDYFDVSRLIANYETALIAFSSVENALVKKYRTDFDKIPELMNSIAKRATTIVFLNDADITKLNDELMSLIAKERNNAIELTRSVFHKETVDKDSVNARLLGFSSRIGLLYGSMKSRILRLSQTMQ